MNKFILSVTTFVIASVAEANKQQPADSCCIVFPRKDFKGRGQEYCIDNTKRQSAFLFQSWRKNTKDRQLKPGSVKCGAKVEAKICQSGFAKTKAETMTDYKEQQQICEGDVEGQSSVGARQEVDSVLLDKRRSSIIIDHHPWVAKGPAYIRLSREEKASIIWGKVTENDQMGEYHGEDMLKIDPQLVFDEEGDEFDCRYKANHGIGNVAKVFWVDGGNHDYTGMFKGGDTGFVRLSVNTSIVLSPDMQERPEPFANTKFKMLQALGVKFLRDGMDSANAFGSVEPGQDDYNYFGRSLASGKKQPRADAGFQKDFIEFAKTFKKETDFLIHLGNSNFSEYDQWGAKEENPVFPFRVYYEPTGEIVFPADTYDTPFTTYLQSIQAGETLYNVLAQAEPDAPIERIGKLVLASRLVTSNWGDNHMFFRHQRLDDDLREYRPDWLNSYVPQLWPWETEATIRPVKPKPESNCPFSFLFY